MATLTLTVVGGLIGGPIGGLVGGLVGAALDSFLIFPAIFGQKTLEGPRIKELNIISGSEGSPMNWVLGPRNRVGGTVIWKSQLIEVKTTRRVGSGPAAQRVSNFNYFVDIAIHWTDTEGMEAPISRVLKILADAKPIYSVDDGGDTASYQELVHYDGSQTTPDPLIESYKGVGNTPAFVNSCYSRFTRLGITPFGNRIPNLEGIIEQDNNMTVGDAVRLILRRSGLGDDNIDTTRLTSCFDGYVVSGILDVATIAAPLTTAYGITVQEIGAQIICFPRGSETLIPIDPDDLASHPEREDTDRPISVKDVDDYAMPSDVALRYYDIDADLQRGEQTAHRADHPARSVASFDLPITLSGSNALITAKRILFSAESERQEISLRLPPSYIYLNEGDVIGPFEADGEQYIVWIRDITRGADLRIEIAGTSFDPDTYVQRAEVDQIAGPGGTVYHPPDVLQVFAELPALRNDDVSSVGFYYFTCAVDPDAEWRGASLLSSADDASFTEIGTASAEAPIGTCAEAMGDGPTTVIDERNALVVYMSQGGMSTVSEAECIRGSNRGAVKTRNGWEIIGFVQADLIGTRLYRLSRLLRGLRNTEAYTDDHYSGSTFVLLETESGSFADLGLEGLGSDDYYKIVPSQGTISAYTSERLAIVGQTEKPFSPCHIEGEWDVSGNFTLSWVRRSKSIVAPFQAAPLASDEVPETYEVDFFYGPGDDLVLRTVRIEGATTTVYSAADQSADGIAASVSIIPGSTPWHVRVYQISREVGRGNAGETIIFP